MAGVGGFDNKSIIVNIIEKMEEFCGRQGHRDGDRSKALASEFRQAGCCV